jgi:biopolymer transport protein ExbB
MNRFLTLLALAPLAGAACAADAGPTLRIDLFEQLSGGGVGIWVIGALSVLSVAVALERFRRFRTAAVVPAGLVDEVVPLWRAGRFDEVERVLKQHDSVLARVVRFVVTQRARWTPAVLEERAGELAARELRLAQHKAYPLAVVATVAPIVGLLGTVVGMIEAFHVIAFTGGMGDASLLAGGISKALVNTAAGLSVALPSLGLHHWFRHRLVVSGITMEAEVEKLFDAVITPGAADAH